ncbi:MAG: YfiR family protein [Bacteroidales bacterium]|nr:YfiR family protein [Bacteroidales bacterium]
MILKKIKYSISIILALLLFNSQRVSAQKYTESQLKAGYIINFTKFVKWPDSLANQNFVFGIYGDDIFGDVFQKMLEARYKSPNNWILTEYNSIKEIEYCHVLFINSNNQDEINEILKLLSGKPVLTIGNNIPYFCQRGGIINFISEPNGKKFEINYISAKNKGFIIDSRLLAVAKLISASGY